MELESELKAKFSNIFIMLLYSVMTKDLNKVKHFISDSIYYEYQDVIDKLNERNETQLYDELNVGDEINCGIFTEGEKVDVTGYTRGRGFTGVIQRWNNHRHRMTHGVSIVHRASGSMGANSLPSRVFKGKKLAGQYGNEKVTIQNLEVVKVDTDRNVLLIKGAVPGPKGAILSIKTAVKVK